MYDLLIVPTTDMDLKQSLYHVSQKKTQIVIFLANNKDNFTKIGTYTNSTMLSPNLSSDLKTKMFF